MLTFCRKNAQIEEILSNFAANFNLTLQLWKI